MRRVSFVMTFVFTSGCMKCENWMAAIDYASAQKVNNSLHAALLVPNTRVVVFIARRTGPYVSLDIYSLFCYRSVPMEQLFVHGTFARGKGGKNQQGIDVKNTERYTQRRSKY